MFLISDQRHLAGSTRAYRRGGHSPAVIGLVFVLGVALGCFVPWRDASQRAAVAVAASASLESPALPAQAASDGGWSRSGNASARHPVEVMRILDGDTFEARVHLWPGLEMTTRVRLRGIDAPELKAACPQESQMAQAARDALQAMLASGAVTIFNIGPDKYHGRVVAAAATSGIPDISAALLAAGHGRSYNGGRRSGWCDSASR